MFDVIVVGAGLFGTAAARHLCKKLGDREGKAAPKIAIVGPLEPKNIESHDGVFSSHYDQSRIVRRLSRDLPWAILTDRSLPEYHEIQKQTGVEFFYPRKAVHVAPSDKASVFFDAIDGICKKMDIPTDYLMSAEAICEAFPVLGHFDNCQAYLEHEPAGHLNPRKLIDAQLQMVSSLGGEHINDIVTGIERKDGFLEVSTKNNQIYKARKVLLTAGSYTNSPNILPKPLDIRVKAESLILVEISKAEFERLGDFPTFSYEYETDRINVLYMPPPLLFPDGKYYIKIGCNTGGDRYLDSPEQINEWMRNGKNDDYNQDMLDALKMVIPDLEVLSVASKRCIITYTPNSRPMIDRVDEGLFVATGGNGLGAKASDGIGALAADVVINNQWVDTELNFEDFAAKFAEHEQNDGDFSRYGMARNDLTENALADNNSAETDKAEQ